MKNIPKPATKYALAFVIILLAVPCRHVGAVLLINSNDVAGNTFTHGLSFSDMNDNDKLYNDIFDYSNIVVRQVGSGAGQINYVMAQPGDTQASLTFIYDFSRSKYKPTSMVVTDSLKSVYSSTRSTTVTTAYSTTGTTWTPIRSITTVGKTSDQASAGTSASISLSSASIVYYRVTFAANTGAFGNASDRWNTLQPSGGNAPFQIVFTLSGSSVAPVTITPSDPSTVQLGIDAAYKAGDSSVIIPSGTYVLSTTKSFHLRCIQMKDFTIDATGCTFECSSRNKRSMQFVDCKNVTFKGATFTRTTIPSSQGTIKSIAENRKSIVVDIDEGYPTDVVASGTTPTAYFAGLSHVNVFDPSTRVIKPPELYLQNCSQNATTKAMTFNFSSSIPSAFPINVDDPVGWRGAVMPDLDLTHCSGMTIDGVTIKGGTGMVFRELCGNGGNTYNNCIITYPDKPSGATANPLIASNADGFHSRQLRRGPAMIDCHVEGADDDAIAFHGMSGLIFEKPAPNVIIADARKIPATGYPSSGYLNDSQLEFARVGDILRFYDLTCSYYDEATITSATLLSGYTPPQGPPAGYGVFASDTANARYWKYTLDHNVNAAYGWLIGNISANSSTFSIADCTTRNHRARGAMIRCSSGTISGCQFTDVLQGGIIVGPELTGWNEGDFASDITITGNTITRCGSGRKPNYGAMTVGAYEFGAFVPLPAGHRDIVISNNTFTNNDGVNLLVSSASGVEITGNVFLNPMYNEIYHGGSYGVSQGALIWLTEVEDVHIADNLVDSPGPYLTDPVVGTLSASGTGFDTGVVLIQKTKALFTGGNSSMVVDAYPGMIGGGWQDIWGTVTNISAISATATNAVPLSAGRGNYLSVTMAATSSASSAGGVYRALDTPPSGIDLTQPHRISFDFRPETVNSAVRYVLYSRIGSPWHTTDSSNTWSIQGTATGWKYNNGNGAGGATLTNTTFTSLAANQTYHFTVDIYPSTKTWNFKISDGTNTYTSPTAGFRVNSTTDGSYLHFGVTNSSTSSNTFNYSVDSIGVTNVIY